MKKATILILLTISFLTHGFRAHCQEQTYKWSDELELLGRIDKLPEYRTNQIVEQISSYDRTGGNDDGFGGTYSYIRKENNGLVIADFKGPGIVNRIWTPTPTNDTLLFYFDGENTARLKISFMDLFSGKVYPFVKPVCGNEAGGYYCYMPIPYKESLKIVFEGEKILFHQIQSRSLPGINIESWTGEFSPSDKQLLTNICQTWADISPKVTNYTQGLSSNIKTKEETFTLQPGEEHSFFKLNNGGRIVGIEIDGGVSFEGIHKDVVLSANWDNENVEAIYAPLADFFGYAYGKSAMRSMLMGRQSTKNYCFLPMPFDKSAVLKLIYKKREKLQQNPVSVNVKVYYNENKREVANEGKFYSVWRREQPEKGKFYEFLDIKGKGHYVGTIHIAQGLRPGMTLFFEGDDSTFIDGEMRMHGTGSEDYYNGGWYALLDRWDRGVSMPIHGSLDYSLPMNRTGAYRFFLADKMTFENEIFHGIEHGPEGNEFPVDYTSVALFYSNTPLKSRMEPTEELRRVYLPREHVYFPQLMDITAGGGIQIVNDRGIRMNTQNGGMARIMLNDVPEGKYKLSISYFEKPEGADFQVWQRQKQLSDWQTSKNPAEKHRDKISVAEIELTKQTNSITFHVRRNENGTQFELDRIYLERID